MCVFGVVFQSLLKKIFSVSFESRKNFLKDIPPISPFRRNLNGDGALTLF